MIPVSIFWFLKKLLKKKCVNYESLGELEKDMAQLRNNLKEVERELEFHRVQPVVQGDRFLPVMKEFLTAATCRFSELEDLFQDMKTRVCARHSMLYILIIPYKNLCFTDYYFM